ncbi:gamma-glutamylcyclotransferase [Paracraurococcus ruber]|nr:gamma-glutamylcyclotransferase [Paracraurococcus ruber]
MTAGIGLPLFLYGTLLRPAVLDRVAGQRGLARRLRPAILPGHARVALRGTPYPTLRAMPGAETTGALLRCGPQALRRLRAYEGPEYRLVPVTVRTTIGPRRARAWIAPRWRAAAGGWAG